MRKLKDVTIICVDTKNHGQSVFALKKCIEQVTPARCVLLTDIDLTVDGIDVLRIEKINSKAEYSEFIIKELYKYFDTDFCLVVQWDGYILNGESWSDDFLDYDYIGAPWLYIDGRNVGNGGFSLRSYKLQFILGTDPMIEISDPEDQCIGRLYRPYLEKKYNIKFPEDELADTFSYELRTPICKTFGFHGFFHRPYQETVVIKRTGAMGDVIMVEPVLHHFFQKAIL